MIDIRRKDELIAIRNVPDHLPRHNGKKIHISVVYRWMQRGRNGVTLEYIQIGGRRYTTAEALQNFFEAISDRPQLRIESPRERTARAERAYREVERLLYPKGRDKEARSDRFATGTSE